jgi:hypothetical protein
MELGKRAFRTRWVYYGGLYKNIWVDARRCGAFSRRCEEGNEGYKNTCLLEYVSTDVGRFRETRADRLQIYGVRQEAVELRKGREGSCGHVYLIVMMILTKNSFEHRISEGTMRGNLAVMVWYDFGSHF